GLSPGCTVTSALYSLLIYPSPVASSLRKSQSMRFGISARKYMRSKFQAFIKRSSDITQEPGTVLTVVVYFRTFPNTFFADPPASFGFSTFSVKTNMYELDSSL